MEPRDGDQLPFSGLAIILLVLGVMFLQEPVLKGSRPATPSLGTQEVADPKQVPARLWEDPLAAVRKHRSQLPVTAIDMGAMIVAEERSSVPKAPSSVDELAHALQESEPGRLTVLGVSIDGGRYAEDHETRLRTRYAVLSALGIVGYTPERATHISFVEVSRDPPTTRLAREAGSHPRTSELALRLTKVSVSSVISNDSKPQPPDPKLALPYEWLRHNNGKDRILLLWIQEEFLQSRPLTSLADLVSQLGTPPLSDSRNGHRTVRNAKPIDFKLLGPAKSGTLMTMLAEAKSIQEGPPSSLFSELLEVDIYSPSATASEFLLKSKTGFSTHDLREAIWPNPGHGNFLRSIPTDLAMADLIIQELKTRKVTVICEPLKRAIQESASPNSTEQCANHPDQIVLISEWDTAYGRAMPDASENAFRKSSDLWSSRNAFSNASGIARP